MVTRSTAAIKCLLSICSRSFKCKLKTGIKLSYPIESKFLFYFLIDNVKESFIGNIMVCEEFSVIY